MENIVYNNPYMFLILKGDEFPTFINKGELFIPIFLDYKSAEDFKDKYAVNTSSKVVAVVTFKAMEFLNKLFEKNDYIPQIAIYQVEEKFQILNSREFMQAYYKYKDDNNIVLNQLIKRKAPEETILAVLCDSSFYGFVKDRDEGDFDAYKVIFDDTGLLSGIKNVKEPIIKNIPLNNNTLMLFSSKENSEYFKDNNLEVKLQKFYDLKKLIKVIEDSNPSIKSINLNIGEDHYSFDVDILKETFN